MNITNFNCYSSNSVVNEAVSRPRLPLRLNRLERHGRTGNEYNDANIHNADDLLGKSMINYRSTASLINDDNHNTSNEELGPIKMPQVIISIDLYVYCTMKF